MLQNSKCRLCDDRDETANHKKYKSKHDWVGKVRIDQESKNWSNWQIAYAQTRI